MTPVTRKNVSLDEITIHAIEVLEHVTGASKSEIIRRGVQAYWYSMEKMLQFYASSVPAKAREVEAITEQLSGRKRKPARK